ncbi:MAG TPA: PVC-type heme-binding CxxCH protein, partial [Roseimicrobium sp.]|nr:PVC-type heme-binding CxxCH protein [Roseimicrobium sp.]
MASIHLRVVALLCLGAAISGPFDASSVAAAPVAAAKPPVFRAGAVATDITPTNYPVRVNGGFLEKTADKAFDRLHARALALDDGTNRLVICVVDTCMMTRTLLDEAKEMANRKTGLSTDRMLVSATHTHSAPSAMSCLGSREDPAYVAFLPGKIAEAIEGAISRLEPAKIGWSSVDDWDHTFNRRWIRRFDKLITDPYGNASARAHMHPGHQSPDVIGPSGPVDPQLSVLAVMSKDGRPLSVLGNYSQHYFGAPALSADYYGHFARMIGEKLSPKADTNRFVGIMSQGTSGDLQWMDYAAPRRNIGTETYAAEVTERAMEAYASIEWHDWVPLGMTESKLPLNYRVPDAARLEWAKKTVATYEGRMPKNWPEVYSQEALYLHERQKTELKLQVLRIGDLLINTLPNEVYAITGLKLKNQSPAVMTFNIELANGAEGYIPPPEQHALGGYTTWAARTAGLEVQAEPKIVATLLGMQETLLKRSRRAVSSEHGPYARAVLDSRPAAYWRLDEMVIPTAFDASGNGRHARFDFANGVALFLPGVGSGTGVSPDAALKPSAFSGPVQINRSVNIAGGRITTPVKPGRAWTVEFWLWNGLPTSVRPMTGILLTTRNGEQMGITGTLGQPGRLCFSTAANQAPRWVGRTELGLKQWHYVALARDGRKVVVFLDGAEQPEFSGELDTADEAGGLMLGGNGLPGDSLEGRLDEVAFYDRPLGAKELAAHWQISGIPAERKQQAERLEKDSREAALRASPPKFPKEHASVVLGLKPAIYWHLDTLTNGAVPDATPHGIQGTVDGGATLSAETFARFSNGRIRGTLQKSTPVYSVSFWFRNNTANDAGAVTAYLFSKGPDGNSQAPGDHVGIGGTYRKELTGRLIFFNGNQRNEVLGGRTVIPPGTWNHVVVVRDGTRVRAWLNGIAEPEIDGPAAVSAGEAKDIFLGARTDRFAPLDGYLAEWALFDRALTSDDAVKLQRASGLPVGTAKATPAGVLEAKKPVAVLPLTSQPLSPKDALASIHVPKGYRVELMASEPQTMDPVAIDWDVSGRMWVVEMADYPLGMDGNGKSGGRVRVLEDTDGDGRYDKSKIFAEGLNFPNGIIVWRDGVIVTAAPEIVFLRDTDGDGKMDKREVLFTGFFEGNQQLRVNGLRWGLDNWIYCANGGHHAGYGDKTKLVSKVNGREYDLGSHDFRFRPDTGELEVESGPTQFGRNRDDWGNWFGTQNSWPLWHYVLSERYLRRNPYIAPASPVHQVVTPGNPKVYPASPLEKRFHSFDQSGRFTSACAGMIYQDEWLFSDGLRHAFTCEPFHNLAQHNILTDDGTSFGFHRDPAEEKLDFFASEDRWCRPVMTRTGPDGALWVVDMYRYMIEHPQWLPANGKDELLPHYRQGDDRGRIYRVVPVKGDDKEAAKHSIPRIDKMDTAALVAGLESSNGWLRDKIQQWIFWRQDKSVIPALETIATAGRRPTARLHALCILDGLGALKPDLVEKALSDAHPGVRINALRLAETHSNDAVKSAALRLTADTDPKVRLQLALTLGEWDGPKAGEALGRLAVRDHADDYFRAAILSSAVKHEAVLVGVVVVDGGAALDAFSEPLMAMALGMSDRASLAKLLAPMVTATGGAYTAQQMERFQRFLDVLDRRKTSVAQLSE